LGHQPPTGLRHNPLQSLRAFPLQRDEDERPRQEELLDLATPFCEGEKTSAKEGSSLGAKRAPKPLGDLPWVRTMAQIGGCGPRPGRRTGCSGGSSLRVGASNARTDADYSLLDAIEVAVVSVGSLEANGKARGTRVPVP